MPLNNGCTPQARSKNIGRLLHEGREIRQSVAIASKHQRKVCRCRTVVGPRGGRALRCKPRRRR